MFRPAAIAALCLTGACVSETTKPAPSATEGPGDAARGLAYAQNVCAACHAVTPDQGASPNPDAPTFGVVANTPGFNGMALNVWLHSAHQNMPNLIVDQDSIDDLSAYLATLRQHR